MSRSWIAVGACVLCVCACQDGAKKGATPKPPSDPIPLRAGAIREQVRYLPKEHLQQRVKPAPVFRAKARERGGLAAGRVLLAIADASEGLRDIAWEVVHPTRAEWEKDRAAEAKLAELEDLQAEESKFPVEGIRRATYELVLPCQTYRGPGASLIGRNSYYPKHGRNDEALTLRMGANDVRKRLGRPPGCVWRKVEGDPAAPYLEWDVDYTQLTDEEQQSERAATTSAEFTSVLNDMKQELEKFEAVMWRVHREVVREK